MSRGRVAYNEDFLRCVEGGGAVCFGVCHAAREEAEVFFQAFDFGYLEVVSVCKFIIVHKQNLRLARRSGHLLERRHQNSPPTIYRLSSEHRVFGV